MTGYKRGDVALVAFVFPDQSGIKRRPAVIISSEVYHSGRQEVIISAITSNTSRILSGDTMISDWRSCGLLFPSVATAIIRTVKGESLARRLGSLTPADMKAVNDNLRKALEL